MSIVSIDELTVKQIEDFDCNNVDLNIFFRKYAKKNNENNIGKTYVYLDNNKILGYVTLCTASIEHKDISKGYTFSLPKYPIPCIKIARLAVDKHCQRKGIGSKLLHFSLLKALEVSKVIGVYFVLVDAKETSKSFYEQYGLKKIVKKISIYFFISISSIKYSIN